MVTTTVQYLALGRESSPFRVRENVCKASFLYVDKVVFCVSVFRIIGKTARSQDIYYSVSVQIQKNFAKSKWKVSAKFYCPTLSVLAPDLRLSPALLSGLLRP